jgi:hypothetical protein
MPSYIADSVSLRNDLGSVACCGADAESASAPDETQISQLARAIYDALKENDPNAFMGSFETIEEEPYVDGRVTIDGRFNMIALARRINMFFRKTA